MGLLITLKSLYHSIGLKSIGFKIISLLFIRRLSLFEVFGNLFSPRNPTRHQQRFLKFNTIQLLIKIATSNLDHESRNTCFDVVLLHPPKSCAYFNLPSHMYSFPYILYQLLNLHHAPGNLNREQYSHLSPFPCLSASCLVDNPVQTERVERINQSPK